MAPKRGHEGTEMTTNNESLAQNYDSDKQKIAIDSDIGVLKIRQRLAAHSGRRNCSFTVKLNFQWVLTVY